MTNKENWQKAIKIIRKNGVRFRQNVMACCRNCASVELYDEGKPYGFTFGGQGCKYFWSADGNTMHKENSFHHVLDNPEVYVNYSSAGGGEKTTLEVGEIIAEAFRFYGFVVVWDGRESSAVVVKCVS